MMAAHDGGTVPADPGTGGQPAPSPNGGAAPPRRSRAAGPAKATRGAPRAKKAATTKAPATARPRTKAADRSRPHTLAIDIGGTGLKASVLDRSGTMQADRVRVPTTYPMAPSGARGMVGVLAKLVQQLPEADRISAGFPGMVRNGRILSAPHFVGVGGPGSPADPELTKAWTGFDMATALSKAIGKPARVANDADVQGLAVMEGKGLELVITLGTGFGTAVFMDGRMLPHLEIAHQPFRKGETYNEQLGERVRKVIGNSRWRKRVRLAVDTLGDMLFFDRLYIGGGNARRVPLKALGDVASRTTIVDNTAGILGGVKLWEDRHLAV